MKVGKMFQSELACYGHPVQTVIHIHHVECCGLKCFCLWAVEIPVPIVVMAKGNM